MLGDAGNALQGFGQGRRIVDGRKAAIENPQAVVGDVGGAVALAQRGRGPQSRQLALHDLDGEGDDLDGQRKGVQLVDELGLVDEKATTFSRSKAPPPPLVRFKRGSASSAPSKQRSNDETLSKLTTSMPTLWAWFLVASDVGMALILSPSFLTRSPRAATAKRAVLPVPRPTFMPDSIRLTACSAARFFCRSTRDSSVMGAPHGAYTGAPSIAEDLPTGGDASKRTVGPSLLTTTAPAVTVGP